MRVDERSVLCQRDSFAMHLFNVRLNQRIERANQMMAEAQAIVDEALCFWWLPKFLRSKK